jgi:hypothetical protein
MARKIRIFPGRARGEPYGSQLYGVPIWNPARLVSEPIKLIVNGFKHILRCPAADSHGSPHGSLIPLEKGALKYCA